MPAELLAHTGHRSPRSERGLAWCPLPHQRRPRPDPAKLTATRQFYDGMEQIAAIVGVIRTTGYRDLSVLNRDSAALA